MPRRLRSFEDAEGVSVIRGLWVLRTLMNFARRGRAAYSLVVGNGDMMLCQRRSRTPPHMHRDDRYLATRIQDSGQGRGNLALALKAGSVAACVDFFVIQSSTDSFTFACVTQQ